MVREHAEDPVEHAGELGAASAGVEEVGRSVRRRSVSK